MRYMLFFFIIFFTFGIQFGLANCTCNNCPLNLPTIGTTSSTLTISGATSGTLGVNNQRLRAVKINFVHNAIREMELRLVAPNGSQVTLIRRIGGVSSSQNIVWDICFLDCIEPSSPDPGFSQIFNNTEPWVPGSSYSGSYYPSVGCLGDLTGNVNGTWTLQYQDFIAIDGGTLFSWSLEFEDNNGTGCTNTCTTASPNTCQANGGEITPIVFNACQNSPSLNLNIPVSFGPNTPDPNQYSYYYIITSPAGIITDILPSPNLTNFPAGTYNVCGLSVLNSDFPLIPTPNGVLSISDIQSGIDSDLYCADLSLNCWQVVIIANNFNPVIEGPSEVCANQLATYTITGIDPQFLTFGSVQAPFSSANISLPNISVIWLPGSPTRTVCFNYTTPCGSGQICRTITILEDFDFQINGPTEVCPGVPTLYTLSPTAPPGSTWQVNVQGGTIISQNGEEISIVWNAGAPTNQISVSLIGGPCGTTPSETLTVNIQNYQLPTPTFSPNFLCFPGQGQANIPANPNILSYTWSATGLNIISGQNTNSITYTSAQAVNGQLCLEVMTSCGPQGPVCIDIPIIDGSVDDPIIEGPLEVCPGIPTTYTIQNYDPNVNYVVQITQGAFGFFTVFGPTINVSLISGPVILCVTAQSPCSNSTTSCITVEVLDPFNDIEISGPTTVCPNTEEGYTISPSLPAGASWNISVTGGTLTSQNGNEFTVLWNNTAGNNNIQVSLINGPCGNVGPVTLPINVISYTLPNNLNSTSPLCFGVNGQSSIQPNAQITQYLWSGTGVTILSGQNTNSITYAFDQAGVAQICLEVITTCGTQGPFCENIQILNSPSPTINPLDPSCSLSFVLEGNSTPGSSITWQLISGSSGANIQSPNANNTTVEVGGPGSYTFQFTENNGACIGSATTTVIIPAPPVVANISYDCQGGTEFYIATITIAGGQGPYIVNGENVIGNTYSFPQAPDGSIISGLIIDANGCEESIEIIYQCPCISDAGTMSTNELTACISSGNQVTATHNGDATFDLGDIGVYILHTGAGSTLGTVLAINPDGIFSFLPGMLPGVTYYISYVVGPTLSGNIDLAAPCLSVSIGQPVVFFEDPQIVFSTPPSVCPPQGTLSASVIGIFSSVQWTQITGPAPSTIASPGSLLTAVSFTQSGTYIFQLEIGNGPCTIVDQVSILVQSLPTLSNIVNTCLGADTYTLSFDLVDPSLVSSIDIPGAFNGNTFTSGLLDPNTVYSISIQLTNGCSLNLNSGPIDCVCLNNSGTMSSTLLTSCISSLETVTATYNNDGIFQVGDIGTFVLHDSPGTNLGNIIASNENGEFQFLPGMIPGFTYYISYIVGQANGTNIDLNDPCLKVAAGQPVIFYGDPEINFDFEDRVCGLSAILTAELSSTESIQWESISGPGIAQIENPSSASTTVNVSTSGTYLFSASVFNPACTVTEEFNIQFTTQPIVQGIRTECFDSNSYQLIFEIFGGTAPISVSISGTLTENTFFSEALRPDSSYQIIVSDGNNCTFSFTVDPVDCSCQGQLGTLTPTSPITLCEEENIDLTIFELEGYLPAEGYQLYFILHDGTASTIGNILSQSTSDMLQWSEDLSAGQTYFITAILSTGTEEEINFEDPCFEASIGVPVVWQQGPIVRIEGSVSVCEGDEIQITVESTGPFPFQIVLGNNANDQIIISEITEGFQRITIPSIVGTTTWTIQDVIAACPPSFSGNFISQVIQPESVSLLPIGPVCNNSIFGSQIDLNDSKTPASSIGIWTYLGQPIPNGVFDFNGFDPGIYEFIFDTRGFSDPCPGATYSLSLEVIECLCPTVNVESSLAFCAGDFNFQLSNIVQTPVPGAWSLLNPNGLPTSPSIDNGELVISSENSGAFTLVFRLTDDFPDECQREFFVPLVIEKPISAGSLVQENTNFCENISELIDLRTLIQNPADDGRWLSENGIELSQTQLSISDLNIGANKFVFRVDETDLCPGDELEITINVIPAPEYIIEKEDPICPEEIFGSIMILSTNDASIRVNLNNNPSPSTNLGNLPPGRYQIEVFNLEGCSGGEEIIEILPAPIYETNVTDNISATVGTLVELRIESTLPDSLISSIEWSDDDGIFNSSDRTVFYSIRQNTEVIVRITTIDGCLYERTIQISVRIPNIIMPNVFSPSGQQVNNTFGPTGVSGSIEIEEFRIFDRWGNLVHFQENKQANDPDLYWDGRFHGMDLQPGVFVYTLSYKDGNNTRIIKGDVTLIR